MTRGELNCNPLNIRRVAGTTWEGQRAEQTDNAFVQFRTIEFGLRAAFVLLHTYATKYHANCIRDIISRWAPPSENDTRAYIRSVCALTGFGGREKLTETEWPALVRAMAVVESRMHLDEGTLKTAYNLYLNLKPKN